MSDKLSTWINQELEERGWSTREFGRRVGISPAHASRVVNGETTPSVKLCKEIAGVLGVIDQEVMIYAGILDPAPPETMRLSEAMRIFARLPPDRQDLLLVQMRAWAEEEERKKGTRTAPATG
jgi:transcriptional regulator with XRE-family HTH domain